MSSDARETTCVLVRDGDRALVLDAGTGARRLVTNRSLLDRVEHVDVVLTHFHLDHVCGLGYLRALSVSVSVWGPGAWLYGSDTREVLDGVCRPPVSPSDLTALYELGELRPGEQEIGGFDLRTSAQPRHWAPSAGIRVGDRLALITDTPYEAASATLAAGVEHLLHEAWSSSRAPLYPEHDATAADAARVAREAGAERLTLVHLNPTLPDLRAVLGDARTIVPEAVLGADEAQLL
jgi:ribonuclease BN (tRNA processing enzyme)